MKEISICNLGLDGKGLQGLVRAVLLATFVLYVALFPASASVYSQSVSLDLKLESSTIESVLKEIEQQSEFSFLYNNKQIDVQQNVSIDVKDKSINEVLSDVLKNTNIRYLIRDRQVVLYNKDIHTKNEMEKIMLAQTQPQKTITGKVIDESGLGMPGVAVVQKGTTIGSITDVDGKFSVSVPEGAILQFSFMGMKTQEVTVGLEGTINISMEPDAIGLEEVVAIGYGTQKKSHLTGSVEVVDAKKMENRPVTSTSALLQGQVAGLTFSTPNGGNAPGSNMTLQIRGQAALSGTTPPLVVIDGVPSDMDAFNALNPNDIESVSVLKDAAATAVYGARAPYGILLINTKMGKKNEKPKISYSGNYGVVTPVRTPKTVDSYTFVLSKNQAAVNGRQSPAFGEEQIALILDNINNPGKYTDEELNPVVSGNWGASPAYNNNWMDIWLRSSFRHQHNLSLRGGGENSSYFVSTGYVYQPGNLSFVEKFDDYKRFNLNGGLTVEVNDWVTMTYRSRYSHETSKEPTTEYNAGRYRLYSYAYSTWPIQPLYFPDGSLSNASRALVAVNGGQRDNKKHHIDNILSFDFSLVKGLSVHVDGTWRIDFSDYQSLRKEVYQNMPSKDQVLVDGTESFLVKQASLNQYWTVQSYVAYERSFRGHTFRMQLGVQAEENNYRLLEGTGKDLFLQDLDALKIAQGERTSSDKLNDWATAGFFGRFNYNFKERYLLEVNGRYDGSGRYVRGKRWGVFPSGSIGWVMSREAFWQKLESIINSSKLRMSYGTLGNQGNSYGYLHVPTMGVGAQTPWIFDGERLAYVTTPKILNMNRTWEKITTSEVGLELGLLNNKLIVESNYFRRRSWDIIGPPDPTTAVLGVSAPQVNNAEFVTKGFELQINYRDFFFSNWVYNVGFTLSDATSEVTKYNTATNSISGWYEGKKFGEIWGYEANRLLRDSDFGEDGKLLINQSKIHAKWSSGDVKYEDLDGDREITTGNSTVEKSGDLKVIGNSTPRYRFGVNLGTEYTFVKAGKLGLSIFLEGLAQRDIFLGDSFFYWGTPPAGWESAHSRSIYEGENLDFYRDENTEARLLKLLGLNTNSYFPRPYDSREGNKNAKTNSRYLQNGAYMRLKNLTITYTFPKKWVKRVHTEGCRIYFSGENLFVLSGLPSYIDPESTGRAYPQQAVYSFGINVDF
ncbi:MAG: TonB-dependent receptor [Bacteroidales bacterium]